MRIFAILLAGFAVALATAQTGASNGQLTFPSAGERRAWVATAVGESAPAQPIIGQEATLEVPLQGVGTRDQVFVWDVTTGNIAVRAASRVGAGWAVSPRDDQFLAEVAVRVESAGQAVASARVRLTVAGRTRETLLSPRQAGEVVFFGVPPGPARVDVAYSTDSGTKSAPTVLVDLKLKRPEARPQLVVALPEGAETVAPSVAAAERPPEAAPVPGPAAVPVRTNPIGMVIMYLVTLAAAIAAGYYGLKWMQRNPQQLEAGLTKLGVKVPDPDTMDSGAAPLTAPPPPAPPQPILLDNAAPTPLAAGIVTSVASAGGALTGSPRIVRDSGGTTDLPEGETLVGREVPGPLSLAAEDTLSRRHAALIRAGDTVTVRDLGSTNGTFVNGIKVDEAVLRSGDAVQFGAVRFRYEG